MKERYRWFYAKNLIDQKRPTICACLVENDDEDIGGIGISICSNSDNPFHKRGRGKAFARAHHAFISDKPSEPILREEAIMVILETALPIVPAYKAIPSGTPCFDQLKDKFWPPRERTSDEESKDKS